MSRLPIAMNFFIVCATTAALAACASSAPLGPNGGVMVSVECSSSAVDSCYQPAAKACPNGYALVDQQVKPGGTGTPSTQGYFVAGTNTVMAECRK